MYNDITVYLHKSTNKWNEKKKHLKFTKILNNLILLLWIRVKCGVFFKKQNYFIIQFIITVVVFVAYLSLIHVKFHCWIAKGKLYNNYHVITDYLQSD